MQTKSSWNFWYVIFAIWGIFFLQQFWTSYQQVETIPYSQFHKALENHDLKEITISQDYISGKLKKPLPDGRDQIFTVRVQPTFANQLSKFGVKYTGKIESTLIPTLLSWVIPALVFVGIWVFFFRHFAEKRGLGGMMSIGKSKAKVYMEKDTKVTFEDVAGIDEAKAELEEIVNFLKSTEKYGRLGARMPKGVLLVGPPGTGKTLTARAVAGEAGVPFFSINGSEFVEMFVGVGAARVRDLFEQARKLAPCIIFVDEIDALGRARGVFQGTGGSSESEQTLNQLLAELDGFDPQLGVVLLGATNRPEILDQALLRPGRFDRQVLIDRPDKVGRIAILKVHVKKIQMAESVRLEEVAALTPGFSGADLANLVNEAAVIATRRNAKAVTTDDFVDAVERIIAGLEKRNRLLNQHERQVVAHHEMGHALVAIALPGTDPVQKVSIIPRGIGALGYTIQRPIEDRYLMTRGELENKMAVLLGGRAAEEIVFDEISTGASDDLSRVTELARNMVTRFGMDEKLGLVTFESEKAHFLKGSLNPYPEGYHYSEETAREIDCAVHGLVMVAYERAKEILTSHLDSLEKGAQMLLEKETLTQDELPKIQSNESRLLSLNS